MFGRVNKEVRNYNGGRISMEKDLAPIVLFVYNRLEHAKKTIEALKKNHLAEESELFIFSDGPRRDDDIIKVKEVRNYIHQVEGFKQINIIEREKNYGLAQAIVSGVTEVLSQYDKAIVLEDDFVTDVNFLTFMNYGLNKYQNDLQVYSITGYSYLNKGLKNGETYFLRVTTSRSWGTWKDRWQKYDADCEGWTVLKRDRRLRREFDYDFSYPYYDLLKSQMTDERTNSWAIKWYWTIFKNKGLTLYPPISLVSNEGLDGSGEHGVKAKIQRDMIDLSGHDIQREWEFTSDILEKKKMRKKVAKALWQELYNVHKRIIIKDILG